MQPSLQRSSPVFEAGERLLQTLPPPFGRLSLPGAHHTCTALPMG